jgi:hypothetical protein
MLDLSTAIEQLRHVINGGSCSRDIAVREINLAQGWFANRDDWHTTLQVYRFCVTDNCLILPSEINSIRRIRVDGHLVDVHSKWFEYQSNGPGTSDGNWADCYDLLVQEGYSAVITQPTCNNRIIVLSDRKEDAGASVEIFGKDAAGMDLRSDLCSEHRMGLNISLDDWKVFRGGKPTKVNQYNDPKYVDPDKDPCLPFAYKQPCYTKESVSKIDHIKKPRTKGYVWILEYCPDTTNYRVLARMHPNEEVSKYSVWRLRPGNEECKSLSILAHRSFQPAVEDSDVLYIQSLPALYEAVQMLYRRKNGELSAAVSHEVAAERHLLEQVESINRGVAPEVDVHTPTWGTQTRNMQ